MGENDKVILEEILRQRHESYDPDASASRFFELFSAEQILKDYDLSYDEIEYGHIGDSQDGGIDAIYLFVNGELVQEGRDYNSLRKNISVQLVIIQAKATDGFQETPIERFITVSEDIFNLSLDLATLKNVYNESLVDAIDRFHSVYKQLASKFPSLEITYHYVCKGGQPHANVQRKTTKLQETVKRHFGTATFGFHFTGASKLLELARRTPQTTYTLPLAENPISSAGQVGFVCLVGLRNYFNFITNEEGELRRQLFEANVRDYQGRTEVNDEIQGSLREKEQEDFWWLNNGITILATQASQGGKALTIEDPQIVNGLQTSTEIYNYFKKFAVGQDERKILVRVIVPEKAESHDRIIKATNSQTTVLQASLRATDKIHRDIEEFFQPRGLFYDRRKNLHMNEGKPRDKIISIQHLAQAVMAIFLQQPDSARARPSSLLKKNDVYEKVYSEQSPIGLYYTCAAAMRRVEAYLRSPASNLAEKDRNNLRFYVAMHAVAAACGRQKPTARDLAKFELSKLSDERIADSLTIIKALYLQLGASDTLAKGPKLLEAIGAGEVKRSTAG